MNYDTLCFSGGGVKAFSFLGSLKYLLNKKIFEIEKINKFVGTSAGAMIAFLLNLDYTVDEIINFILEFNFSKLQSNPDSIRFLEEKGIDNGEKVLLIIKKFLFSKFKINDITFKELYEKTDKKLVIIGTNYTKGLEKIFSSDETPNFSVIKAIRVSISVPIIFTPVKIDNTNDYYVDGALINNFPINRCNPKTTLGFYVKNSSDNNSFDSIPTFFMNCLGIISDSISKKSIQDNLNIIEIINYKSEMVSFDLNHEKKLKIINMGESFAIKYLEQLNTNIIKSIIDDIILKI